MELEREGPLGFHAHLRLLRRARLLFLVLVPSNGSFSFLATSSRFLLWRGSRIREGYDRCRLEELASRTETIFQLWEAPVVGERIAEVGAILERKCELSYPLHIPSISCVQSQTPFVESGVGPPEDQDVCGCDLFCRIPPQGHIDTSGGIRDPNPSQVLLSALHELQSLAAQHDGDQMDLSATGSDSGDRSRDQGGEVA